MDYAEELRALLRPLGKGKSDDKIFEKYEIKKYVKRFNEDAKERMTGSFIDKNFAEFVILLEQKLNDII